MGAIMNYKRVDNHIWASHWVPNESDDELGLTAGKPYKLTHHEWDSSIVNDKGEVYCEIWVAISGEFVYFEDDIN
jgi:hypothetical protein